MKRFLDVVIAGVGLLMLFPFLTLLCLLVWVQDFHSPFYIPWRIGRWGVKYRMVKLRSMIIKADRSGVDSTAKSDPRITPVGRFIRKFKLDEITQLWNVLKGEMSLVGPRPNVERETELYTDEEKHLLDVRPGITDLASIAFSDEGEIIEGKPDPDIAYNQLIRPYKSRLGLLYVEHSNVALDIKIICLTALAILSREIALRQVGEIVRQLGATEDLIGVATRTSPLVPTPPPGASEIVTARMALK
jgi:lipopolysaccharide/colanic/teichoic acid biosynthesis glycosyltransferase